MLLLTLVTAGVLVQPGVLAAQKRHHVRADISLADTNTLATSSASEDSDAGINHETQKVQTSTPTTTTQTTTPETAPVATTTSSSAFVNPVTDLKNISLPATTSAAIIRQSTPSAPIQNIGLNPALFHIDPSTGYSGSPYTFKKLSTDATIILLGFACVLCLFGVLLIKRLPILPLKNIKPHASQP